jgi:serine/threonine protein kinase
VAKQYKLEKSGLWITLSAKPFAGGGEGNLYKITAPQELRKYVAKLYHPHKLTPIREEKINYLAAYPPIQSDENAGAHNSVIWVKDALYYNGKFVGFIMPYTEGEKLEILTTPKIPKKLRREWARFDFKKPSNALDMRLKLSFNICAAIHQVHSMERYILVDMKPDNIVIQTNGLVSIVDTDSVEVVEAGKSLFDAPVATPEYTPPEHYKKLDYDPTGREAWDRFGLGVILYKLLFGIHPFAASSSAPYEQLTTLHDKIKHGLFVHHPAKKASFTIIPPPHKAFYKLDESLQNLFFRCFIDGHESPDLRPSAEEWCAAILLTLDDEKAYKRYGHILGGGLYSAKPRFALPSARIALPTYSTAATRLVDLSKNSDLPKLKNPVPNQSELKDFQVQSLKRGQLTALAIFVVMSFVIGTPVVGIILSAFLLYRAKNNFKKDSTYRQAQGAKKVLMATQKRYQGKVYRVRQSRKKFKRSVRWVVPKIERLAEEVQKKVEGLKAYLQEQDVRVKELENKALEQYAHLNQKYVEKAKGHRVIARVEDGNYNNLAKIRIAIHSAHKKAVDELTKEKPIKDNHPFMKEGKIAINSLVKDKRTKIGDLIGTKLTALYNEQEARIKLLYQEVREDTFIENHWYRLWKGKRRVSDAAKEELKEALEELKFSSILQIYTINSRTGDITLKDGRTFNVKQFRDSKIIINNLKHWHDETKHQVNALDKEKALLKKSYRQKIKALEDEKQLELKNLDRFKRGELEKVKIETQKIVLGAPFTNLQAQYETVTEYVTELETAYEKEEDLVLKDYRTMYESIVKDCEVRADRVAEDVEDLEEDLQKYSKKINHPKVQKAYRELEQELAVLKRLLPELEVKSFEAKKYKDINFKNYLRKLTRR